MCKAASSAYSMTGLNNPTANSKAVPNIQPNFKCPMDQSHTLMNTKKLTCHEQGFESTSLSNLRSPEQGHRTNRPPMLPKPPTTATAPHLNPARGHAGGEKKSPTQRRLLITGQRRAAERLLRISSPICRAWRWRPAITGSALARVRRRPITL